MRKVQVTLLFLSVILLGCSKEDEKKITLPIEYHEGYGPFIPGWAILSGERKGDPKKDEWLNIYLPLKNLPKGWSHIKRALVWLDTHQLVYQNYKQGKLSKEFYGDLQKSWNWIPDESNLSSTPIKCYVYVIWGVDQTGNWAAMVDTNNDLDFGNEKAFWPEVIERGSQESFKRYTKPMMVRFEKVRKGKVVTAQVPISIKQLGSDFVYNFPRYASSSLSINGKDVKILISSAFMTPWFESTYIVMAPDRTKNVNLERKDLVGVNQVINLGNMITGKKYKNLGVDWYNEVLVLEGVDPGAVQNQYIIQAGYMLEPFEGKEFSSGEIIASNALKGKYVFIDFWGTWCRGCVEALPQLNKIYNNIDKSKVEFVGIACEEAASLQRGIQKYNIKWPQVRSDSLNKLQEKYKITGFPTSILIDNNGEIIDMNLSPEELEERLNKLLTPIVN